MKGRFLFLNFLFVTPSVFSTDNQLLVGQRALNSMTGCYLVDYSYTETEGLQPGYQRDPRVYDVNKNKSVKEWIFAEADSPSRVRLQHILFATDLKGRLLEGSIMKHQGEDWEYEAPFLYEFVAPQNWVVQNLEDHSKSWTRRITNLDDGPRYQCAAKWEETVSYPSWSCGNFSPIPGRETRDMGRKDYNTLERFTQLIVYTGSWLERQRNTKVLYEHEHKTPLAKELGKNWYVRLPDSECTDAQAFSSERRKFWSLLREAWDEVLNGEGPFSEKKGFSRYEKLSELEEEYFSQNLQDPEIRSKVKNHMRRIIGEFQL